MKKFYLSLILAIFAAAAVFILAAQKEEITEVINFLAPHKTKGLVVISPKTNAQVLSPLKITGYVNGNGWIGFEGQVGIVKLLDSENRELASGILEAQGDWMTASPIYFETELTFSTNETQPATLLFLNENPSDILANHREFRLPLTIVPIQGKTITIKVYFNNDKLDPEFSCNKVFATERVIPETKATARAALEELLEGPMMLEQNNGYFTSINPGVEINSLIIQNNVAKVDFNPQLEYQVGGSCRVSAIRAQITQTLKQFPTIKNVIIAINGRTEDILQP